MPLQLVPPMLGLALLALAAAGSSSPTVCWRWRAEPGWRFAPHGTPAVSPDGTLFVPALRQHVGLNQGWLLALDANGTQRWRNETGSSDSGFDQCSLCATVGGAAGSVLALAGVGSTMAVGTRTGEVSWRFRVAGGDPAVGHKSGTVFVGGGYPPAVHALSPTTGSELWHAAGAGGSPAVSDDETTVYAGGRPGSATEALFALDTRTGRQRWRTSVPGGLLGGGPPVIGSDAIFLVSNCSCQGPHRLIKLSADSGAVQWRAPLSLWASVPPTLSAQHGLVFLVEYTLRDGNAANSTLVAICTESGAARVGVLAER